MTSKPKRAAKRQPAQDKSQETPAASPTTIVVRRGALKRFDSMKKKTEGLPVNLVWDRRVGRERRADTAGAETRERRASDRRQQPPFTWTLADFVVVVPADGDAVKATPERESDPVEKKRGKE